MRIIEASAVHAAVRQMILAANRVLGDDVYAALKSSMESETSASGREVLRQLLENADLAASGGLALCQDTGAAVFFVEMGEDVRLGGGSLQHVLNSAMAQAYEEGCLRKSMCHPLTRCNTGDNRPAIVHTELVEGDRLTIRYMAKGGGSENMSRCTMLTPAQGWQGIKEFVVRRMAEAGPNPCPPTIVGVGIGGTFDLAPALAKRALFRRLDDVHPDAEVAAMETELLDALNALGIGPMGLGGRTTCLAVKIALHPCHIASLPVAVNVQCHSARHREVIL
ncbi:hydro-lyase, Fe-S type, tartrate/fumarate subfamily, alpha subunit [Oleidesulfovibrio alaskensis G20]|uniref:Hydro-lyase, Fe-S type, tartrate/fumarate subfamily, alpha subunit n=1 Tax=Oleidesulfovibrio alaskensis (strain ATCC BAA-1058 / DSM 17464 / G20) TaxID=207559 RepID=Q30V64_OLEA2|nr:fumarate hydratase [Oleidesulfovibrio alaskensis]ABB40432.1 hydro-lyase, Fe-S type, tartrate/fumarate subfamily, alpha subunit [Oleidesulfovibrio alaskensis G20]MBG0772695.1 fumarate hydratase [Oleidesulfovibrio alaskensis]MBL3581874.1 fumarate hydratase [Oleidesulfovibrio alaskensis]